MYPKLNFPTTNLKLKGDKVWDILQSKFVRLTPEEWVRQHMIHFLINEKMFSKNLMQSEYTVKYNNLNKRCDIVVFNNSLKPLIIVECKAPKIKLTEDTFYQIARYHATLRAPLLILTNGIQHINALVSEKSTDIKFLENTPTKEELSALI